MKNLKTIILSTIAITFLLLSCSNSNGTNNQNSSLHNKIDRSIEKSTDSPKTVSGDIIVINSNDFRKNIMDYQVNKQWEYKGDKPCIVDFYADWCKPCRMISPYLKELAKEYADEIYIYKVNTDKNKEVARAFNIRGIPALLFCPIEGEPQMLTGARSKADFDKLIKSVLLKE